MTKQKASANTISVEEKLKALYELQLINSQMNDIKKLQGELPMEVEDLENEIEGLDGRIDRLGVELKNLDLTIAKYQNQIKDAEALIEKYNKQQENVKNNREYDALARERELQHLDIQLANKRIRETKASVMNKELTIEASNKKLDYKKADLEAKKEALGKIILKSEKDEKKFLNKEKRARKLIPEPLLKAYDRVRNAYRNGLGVVTIERDACAGCFNIIPSQTNLELAQRKKIINCEHCGRIIVDTNILNSKEVETDTPAT